MSNAMQILEGLAVQSSRFSTDELSRVIEQAGLPASVRSALVARDIAALKALLGVRGQMLCMVVPAENDEPVEEDPEHEEGDSPDSADAARVA